MTLSELIADYFRLEADLETAMKTQTTPEERAKLLRASAARLDDIEAFRPETPQEQREQVHFFLHRAISRPGVAIDGRDVNTALQLAGRYTEFSGGRLPGLGSKPAGNALISYVRGAKDRVSIISKDHLYVVTSRANAAFYGLHPDAMVGRHVAELIGQDRFNGRARERLESCFDGEPQEYTHSLEQQGVVRLMRCQMKPLRDPALGPAAMVYMADVTGRAAADCT